MTESQGHFKGQRVHSSTLAGQTMQDSLNYRGQQQLSPDLTATGKEGHLEILFFLIFGGHESFL